MKRNVDLTLNRDFGDVEIPSLKLKGKKSSVKHNPIFQEGNYEERRACKMDMEFSTYSGRCDCCGTDILWNFFGSMPICINCEKGIGSDKQPWWFKIKQRTARNLNRLIELQEEFDLMLTNNS